jgi:hypothetical protein
MKGKIVNNQKNDGSANTTTTPTDSLAVRKGMRKRMTSTKLDGYITNM